MKANVRPLGDNIIFQLLVEKTTEAGIIITAIEAEDRILKARIVATGAGKKKGGIVIPLAVNPGDVVLVDKFAMKPYKVGDETIVIGKEDAIFGVLEENEN